MTNIAINDETFEVNQGSESTAHTSFWEFHLARLHLARLHRERVRDVIRQECLCFKVPYSCPWLLQPSNINPLHPPHIPPRVTKIPHCCISIIHALVSLLPAPGQNTIKSSAF